MSFPGKTKFIIGLALVIVLFGQMGWMTPVENFVIWASSPLITTTRSVALSISSTTSKVLAIGSLQEENSDLRQRLIALETENARLNTQLSELKQLEEALGLKSRSGYNLSGARIVSHDPTSLSQIVLIDKGRNSGVIEGQAVIDASGAFVGRITRVFQNTSELTLISDFTSRLPVIVPETGAQGILSGEHGLSVALIEVPQGQKLEVGNRIVTTGFNLGVPAGLFVGYIDQLRTGGGELFQEALVRTAVDLRQLNVVFVVIGTE